MSKVLYVRVDDELHARMVRLAALTGTSINRVVERLLLRALGVPEDLETFDRAVRTSGEVTAR